MHILAIDVGGSAVKYGVCDLEGHISHKGQEPTPMEEDSTVNDLIAVFKQILDRVNAELKSENASAVEGIAIAIPGCVNKDGSLRTGGALPYNYGAPIADLVEKVLGMRPVLENDAKAAAAAELWIGSLRNVESGAVLALGTGLGGGIIVNGKVLQGPNGSAGELSAFVRDYKNFSDSRACEAQNVSATGLILLACEKLGIDYDFHADVNRRRFPLDGRKIFEMYHEGNEKVKEAIKEFGYKTGQLIFNLSVVLNLQKVAIGGGISSQDCLIKAIVEGTKEVWDTNPISHLKPPLIEMPEVVVCQFHNDANLIGAAYQYFLAKGLIKVSQ